MTSVLSFSTMWAQQERFKRDIGYFRRLVASWGYTAVGPDTAFAERRAGI